MGQLHTLRQYDSTALLPMHTFMLLMIVKVYVYMKLKVQWRERKGLVKRSEQYLKREKIFYFLIKKACE